MQFRCPNCQHLVRLENQLLLQADAATPDEVKCPACHSRFSLSTDEQSTAIVDPGLKVAHFEKPVQSRDRRQLRTCSIFE